MLMCTWICIYTKFNYLCHLAKVGNFKENIGLSNKDCYFHSNLSITCLKIWLYVF
jgi:hypothetical protein